VISDTNAANRGHGAIRLQSTASSTKITNTNVSTIGHYSLYVLSSGNNFTSDQFHDHGAKLLRRLLLLQLQQRLTNVLFNKTATASTYSLTGSTETATFFQRHRGLEQHARNRDYAASLYGVTNSNFSNNKFYAYNLQAVWLQGGSTGNIFRNANGHRNLRCSAHGFYIDFSPSNSIFNSNINVSGVGIYIVSSAGGTWMENLTIISSASSGIYVASTTGNSTPT